MTDAWCIQRYCRTVVIVCMLGHCECHWFLESLSFVTQGPITVGIPQRKCIVIWTSFILLLKFHTFQQLSHCASFVQLVKKKYSRLIKI